jgi:Zn-finger nucleic acid-binding protein
MMRRLVHARDHATGLRLALPRRTRVSDASVRYVACPVCKKIMNRQAFSRGSGVVVDVCREHGVFFDAGELSDVLHFIERGGLEQARLREELDRVHERARGRERAREADRALIGLAPIDTMPGALSTTASARSLFGEWVERLVDLWRLP